ncbi:uncharacterized protein LOC130780951 [Actinidia eriantha]|uniref:uncharacterized protein LOC130780951 n=1 Tax=Actinidia eriantha TaxID=165200 RepID=UPI00258F277D|nr:uncharacterized protein LOC130780951 [Actinidia eriantha]
MADYEILVAGLERAGIFFTMLSWVFRSFLFYALLLFSISSFLSFIAPNVQQLLYAYPQPQEPSDDENGAEEQEIGQKKEAENAKDEKEELAANILEIILLEEILENKNQVIGELEQEREKHKEERHAWEKEKTSLEDNVRFIKGMVETFSLQWEEERSQLHAELDAARDSCQRYQEFMHHCDHYNYY